MGHANRRGYDGGQNSLASSFGLDGRLRWLAQRSSSRCDQPWRTHCDRRWLGIHRRNDRLQNSSIRCRNWKGAVDRAVASGWECYADDLPVGLDWQTVFGDRSRWASKDHRGNLKRCSRRLCAAVGHPPTRRLPAQGMLLHIELDGPLLAANLPRVAGWRQDRLVHSAGILRPSAAASFPQSPSLTPQSAIDWRGCARPRTPLLTSTNC